MRRPSLRTAGFALAVVLPVASPAKALPMVGGELRVHRSEAASDCPDEQALGTSTLALGARATEASSGPLDVHVVLDRDEAGYVARIYATGGKSGEREIRSASDRCGDLADATSVALAILFDLLPAEPSAVEPPTSPPRREVARPAPERRQPGRSLVVWLGAHGGLASGLLGHAVTGHVGAAVRARASRHLELGLGALAAPGRDLPHGSGSVAVSLVAGRGDVTVNLANSDRGQLGVRVGVFCGALVGSGTGYDQDYTTTALWLAPGIGVTGRWRVSSHWALTLSTTLLAPHRRQTFSVREVPGRAFDGAPAAVLFELGPELALF